MSDYLNPIQTLDKEGVVLTPGDRVRFVMRGYFLPCEPEYTGTILSIDTWGGIHIQTETPYQHFTSNGNIGDTSNTIYFVHHRYESEKKARIYEAESNGATYYIKKM